MEYHGGCHCGNLSWTLRSGLTPAEFSVRACQCDFCRKLGALSSSDPAGEMSFAAQEPTAVIRYRFGTRSAEFLSCARCGVYVGAQMETAGRAYAIVNLRSFAGEVDFAHRQQPMDYSAEDIDSRRARRRARWTPLRSPI